MLPRRHIGGFFLRAVVFYALLATPWPGLPDTYGTVYRGVANWVFGSFGSKGIVRFQPANTRERGKDTAIILRARGCPQQGTLRHNSRMTAYLPTVEVIALILATTIPWRRRWKALLWGFVLVNGFVAVRLWMTLLESYSGDWPGALYSPGPFWGKVLSGTYEVVGVSPMLGFAVPVFIWILVTFRREDLERFLKPESSKNG